jgi:hypothetical protein
VVDEEQDAKTIDITVRQVRAIQMAPLFILPPILFGIKNPSKQKLTTNYVACQQELFRKG